MLRSLVGSEMCIRDRYRPNRYVKIIEGEVAGPASIGEIKCYELKREFPDLNDGIMEVTLALTALSGFLATLEDFPQLITGILSVAFTLGFLATALFYWMYVLQRIPNTLTNYFHSGLKTRFSNFPILAWLPFYYLVLAFRTIVMPFSTSLQDQSIEFAYLTLSLIHI